VRDPTERLRDMLDAIAAIERYRDRDRASFDGDELLQVWFLRHLQILGEAASGRIRTEDMLFAQQRPATDLIMEASRNPRSESRRRGRWPVRSPPGA
jgi:uncharacterized protein with HEPN domain